MKSEILIILDIDETLVFATKNELEQEYDFTIGDYYVYKRPHLAEFVQYIDNNFVFAVWSSASDKYVEEMIIKLGLKDKVLFWWARSKATFRRPPVFDSEGDLFVDAEGDHFFIKRLKKVKKLGYSLEKILIIDDTPHKSKENYGNSICVSEFKGDEDDTELLALTTYLETLKSVENVRLIEKRSWKEKMNY